jgi:acyl carrier protein
MKTLEQRIAMVLSRTAMIPEELVRPDAELAQLGMGSLEQIECVMALEDELRIELPIADLRKLRTVQDVIDAARHATAHAGST